MAKKKTKECKGDCKWFCVYWVLYRMIWVSFIDIVTFEQKLEVSNFWWKSISGRRKSPKSLMWGACLVGSQSGLSRMSECGKYQVSSNKPMKRSYVIRKIKIKTALRYYYTYIRTAKIPNTDSIKCWLECGDKIVYLPCATIWKHQSVPSFLSQHFFFFMKIKYVWFYSKEIPHIYWEKNIKLVFLEFIHKTNFEEIM